MVLSDEQIEYRDSVRRVAETAQRELIERMIAESESGDGWTGLYMVSKYKEASTPWGIGDWVVDISLRDWLRTYLPKEGANAE